jgi:hypothetical protein
MDQEGVPACLWHLKFIKSVFIALAYWIQLLRCVHFCYGLQQQVYQNGGV